MIRFNMLFCIIGLLVSIVVFLILKRKKTFFLLVDILIAVSVGLIAAALSSIVFYILFAGGYAPHEK